MSERRPFSRFLVVALVLVVVWSCLAARLVNLHLGDHPELREKIANTRKRTQEMLVGRGRILDRNQNIMALDLAMKHVIADPKVVLEGGHSRFVMQQLSRMLELDPAIVSAKINRPGRRYEYIKKYVHADLASEIGSIGMKGIFFDDASARNYPRGPLASHVLGFANLQGEGGAGIELRYDRHLRGVKGLRMIEVDRDQNEIFQLRGMEIPPQEGADVYLTIDQHIQHYTERALDRVMTEHNAKGAWAIVQHVRTGDILAMASRPAYDPNHFRHSKEDERLNRPIGYVYEPGSTFKVAVYAAAINEGLIDPDQMVDCENGVWMHNGKPLRDFHPYGRLTYADALKKSSNIAAAKVALMLGQDKLYAYLRDFGVGRQSGIGLPGEEGGILNPRSRWTSLSISRIAMGHEVAVTSLQLVGMLSAMGNEGFIMRPRLVTKVVNTKGVVIHQENEEVLSRPINGDTARLMRRLLARIAEAGGTGAKAQVPGFNVAGKTGTAEKPGKGGYSADANIASFMGLIPAEDPQLSIIVVVDEPQPEHTGGRVAAPAFREIAEQAVRYLDIPPVAAEKAAEFKAMYAEATM